jgi:hypothetical protein
MPLRFVDRTEEAGFGAVRRLNDASFAVDKDAIPGHHTNLHPASGISAISSPTSSKIELRK